MPASPPMVPNTKDIPISTNGAVIITVKNDPPKNDNFVSKSIFILLYISTVEKPFN